MKHAKQPPSRWQAHWADRESHARFVEEVSSHLQGGEMEYTSDNWPKIRPYVGDTDQEQERLSVVLGRDIMSTLSRRNVKLHVQCRIEPVHGDMGYLLRIVAVKFPAEAIGQSART